MKVAGRGQIPESVNRPKFDENNKWYMVKGCRIRKLRARVLTLETLNKGVVDYLVHARNVT